MSILGTGISGLLAFQQSLATTSHNIANAATEGYSRQRAELSARPAQFLGGSYLGQGVQVSNIRRLQDELVGAHLRSSLTDNANSEVRAAFAERVDRLLADESTGLAPTLENYFAAVQDVADDPTAIPGRTVFLKEAETLAARFGAVNGQLEEQRSLVNGQIKTTVEEINQYAQSLADLNRKIVSGSTSGSPANDLLDQRDNLLNKLSEKIDLSTSKQDDGAINVFIGNGQALVMGGGVRQLVAAPLSGDKTNLDIGFASSSGGQPVDVTRFMSGGELGGLLETRASVLDTAQNELGLIGLTLATKFNEKNQMGLDLNGDLGGPIFDEVPQPVVHKATGNTASNLPDVKFADVTKLTASDYQLSDVGGATPFTLTRVPGNASVALVAEQFATAPIGTSTGSPDVEVADASKVTASNLRLSTNGTIFQLTRLSDNKTETLVNGVAAELGLSIDTSTLSLSSGDSWDIKPSILVGDGLRIDTTGLTAAVSPAKNAVPGDSWLIQPTRTAASNIKVAITDPEEIAAAAAVSANSSDLNTGTATIESVRAFDTSDSTTLFQRAIVSYDETTSQYTVNAQNTLGAWTDVTSSATQTTTDGVTTITANGWELKIKGTPDDGDEFIVAKNEDNPGDNRNMLAMSALQDDRLVAGHTTTFQGGYNSILAEVGSETRQAQIARDSSAVLLADAQAQRESISGVNLDEEAANLIRFQQAYQAAAQVIAVSSTLFDTLLSAVRR
ncbi:flagellar hook-associated protein FlgK [Thiocystis minor]|uniref:flagellar hook-associated protein FlgK n=1 Tax=Thiocystis minor TaxID=61597 RepID=UPI001911744D|nr:flagellar hook-associated protein FlgK [Thiocystis minor]MBK5962741.1 flagellar hook-associated protein FlgK [Thiocystis minor]